MNFIHLLGCDTIEQTSETNLAKNRHKLKNGTWRGQKT